VFTKLSLKNFRAFAQASVELSKINLFFGPNNAGKSSLLSALNLVCQTVQNADIGVDLSLSGKFEDFGSYFDMVNGNDESKQITIGIGAELTIPRRSYVPSKGGGRLLKVTEETHKGDLEIQIGYRRQRHEVRLLAVEISVPSENLLVRTRRNQRGRHVVDLAKGFEDLSIDQWHEMISVRNLIPAILLGESVSPHHAAYEKLRTIRGFAMALRQQINNVEFIGPFRSNPQRLYSLTGESPSHVGKHGERALEIMMQDEKRKGKEKKRLMQLVSNWLKEAEIARSIYTQPMTDRYFEVIVKNFYTGEEENLTDVGFGCSQVLPVMIAGFNVGEGGVFIVQEPEIHLHPKAQAALGSVFKLLYKRGIQLIIETHSEHLMLRLQSYVARGDIKAEDVNVYYVDPAAKMKKKDPIKIEIAEDGYFREEWPKGFFPERLQEAKRLAGLSVKKE
jgi:predicted ATPase